MIYTVLLMITAKYPFARNFPSPETVSKDTIGNRLLRRRSHDEYAEQNYYYIISAFLNSSISLFP